VTSPALLDPRYAGVEKRPLDAERLALEDVAGHTARHVELLDYILACAEFPVVKPWHEMADGRSKMTEVGGQKLEPGG